MREKKIFSLAIRKDSINRPINPQYQNLCESCTRMKMNVEERQLKGVKSELCGTLEGLFRAPYSRT